MTIVILNGGLGNQLFQVSVGLYLSAKKGGVLRLNDQFLTAHKIKRPYLISALGLPLRRVGLMGRFGVKIVRQLARMAPQLNFLRRNVLWCYIQETQDETAGVPSHLDGSFVAILDGYWQLSSNTEGCLNYLRQYILARPFDDAGAAELASTVALQESVALHVRRKDYIDDPVTHSFHGNCTVEYYNRALGALRSRVALDHIFVFSDDISWAATHLSLGANVTFVNKDGRFSDVDEFLIMACCHHFIIANSTFSWWAARLAMYEHKVVIAPRRWFVHSDDKVNGLFPSDWNLVE
jgi:hypothetical protein